MKKVLLGLALSVFVVNQSQAQLFKGLFKKRSKSTTTKASKAKKKKAKKTEVALYEGDFTDKNGWSGVYYTDTLWHYGRDWYNKAELLDSNYNNSDIEFTTKVKFKFTKIKDGNVVNEIGRFITKGQEYGTDGTYVLMEKYFRKYGIAHFKRPNYEYNYVVLEPGVIFSFKGDMYDFDVEKPLGVFVKDKAKLSQWNMEVALAKFEQLAIKQKKLKAEQEKKKFKENPVYNKMVGKIGFLDTYRKVTSGSYGHKFKEKMDAFSSSIDLGGSSIFYKSYYETPGELLCPGCDRNTTFEINGKKAGRMQQRLESATWSRMIKQRKVDDNYVHGTPPIVNYQRSIADYAFLKVLYENKDKLTNGARLKLKVTETTCRDGVDQHVLATGTLILVVKEKNRSDINKILDWYETKFVD